MTSRIPLKSINIDTEFFHSLLFWTELLLITRNQNKRRLPTPQANALRIYTATLQANWKVEMRYRSVGVEAQEWRDVKEAVLGMSKRLSSGFTRTMTVYGGKVMPRGHIVPAPEIDAQRLQTQLEREWENAGQESEPVIIEEPAGIGDYRRIYVVWSQWAGLSHRDRAQTILQAYQNTHTEDQLQNVTVATGYTPNEAANIGLRYELE